MFGCMLVTEGILPWTAHVSQENMYVQWKVFRVTEFCLNNMKGDFESLTGFATVTSQKVLVAVQVMTYINQGKKIKK